MKTRAIAGRRVRLVKFTRLFAGCPMCGGFMIAVGKFAIEVDGKQPCNECCTELLGEQRFAELNLASL